MNTATIEAVEREAGRFLEKLKDLKSAGLANEESWHSNPKQSGAVRRASMDLTRALADLRRAS